MRKLRQQKPLAERFWAKVNKTTDQECWFWTGAPDSVGYGQINKGRVGEGMVRAHRLSWEIHNGPIQRLSGHHGAVVMHTCDNRLCVNPGHLRLGTQGDNVADMDTKGRRRSKNLRGTAHGLSKWTEDQVRAVKRATGPYKKIAEQTGVAYGSVKQIKRGNVWRHIE